MEQILKEPIQFSEGVNLRDLISGTSHFHIDATFENSSTPVGDPVINLYEDEDEKNNSDSDDVLSGIADSIKKQTLSSPEYKSFSDLEAIMIDCTSGGDVKLYIVEEGNGPLVPPDAVVTMHYAAYWEGEKIPFDTTLTMNFGAPQRFHLGHRGILPGLEIGLSHVKGPSARFHLLLHQRVTWGELGVLPRIRPETSLFVIELYNVEDPNAAQRFNDLPSEKQSNFEVTIETVKSLHNQAKQLFKKRKYFKVMKNYQQATHVMCLSRIENETQEVQINELKIKNYINLAVCYYKLKKPKHILNVCDCLEKLIVTERNCKIMFYYGRAYEMLGKTDDAMKYYRKALRLEPKNTEIAAAIVALNHRAMEDAEKEKSFWCSAFNAGTVEKNCEVPHDVDEDLQSTIREVCEELTSRTDLVKLDLSSRLTRSQLDYLKSVTAKYENLFVLVEGEGRNRTVTIVKKNL